MTSKIDELFEQIFGWKPTKKGTSYEMISAAVMKLLGDKNPVFHDKKLMGKFSETLYQIDVLLMNDGNKIMGEAKDYTDRDSKVGRPDLQKLGGALGDLDVKAGAFFSATDYTKPAKDYAAASSEITGKEIELYHLRPSTKSDEKGRIKEILIQMHVLLPQYETGVFLPNCAEKGRRKLKEMKDRNIILEGTPIKIEVIYDKNGSPLTSIRELTSKSLGVDFKDKEAIGAFSIPGGHLKIHDELIEIDSISYRIPFSETIEEIVISANGEAKLLIKGENGNIDKLITDGDLKKVKFKEDGEAYI